MAEEYKNSISILGMINTLSDGVKDLINRFINLNNSLKLVTDRVTTMENIMTGGVEDGGAADATTVNSEVIYNRIKDDLLSGKIVPLTSNSASSISDVTITDLKQELVELSTAANSQMASGGVTVARAREADTINGLTLSDLYDEIDLRLARKYLTTGKFTESVYIMEEASNRLPINLEDNNRAIFLFKNRAILHEDEYVLDGNTIEFTTELPVGTVITVKSFNELMLLNDDNLVNLIGRIEDNRLNFLSKIRETALSSEFVDALITKIDAKIVDLSIVDGKIRIEDDAIYSADNGIGDNSDWTILNVTDDNSDGTDDNSNLPT